LRTFGSKPNVSLRAHWYHFGVTVPRPPQCLRGGCRRLFNEVSVGIGRDSDAAEGRVSKTSPAKDGADKRRSTRLTLALPIKVKGVDALHEAFTEQTRTVMISCHGCKYVSRHYVTKGSEVRLEIPRGEPKAPATRHNREGDLGSAPESHA